ncbi:MAG TPA: hypothetical protein VJT50_10060 [Pyrinomonadaceae bacterium]|nr:hypothetical protein [Pyrinomonadaceae bacterium]
MLSETFSAVSTATRRVFGNWSALAMVIVVYLALLVTLYSFVAVREASVTQVAITFALAIIAPLLFFLLQAMIAAGFGDPSPTAGLLAKRSLVDFWKLIIITIPLVALAVLIVYLLAKYQSHLAATSPPPELHPMAARGHEAARPPINWKGAAISTVRYLALGLFLPLAAIHLWVATVRDGLFTALKRVGSVLGRAFAPQSVLIYLLGFLIFAVVPYLLLFRATPNKRAWLDISLLSFRLAAVAALMLIGWAITVKAIAYLQRAPAEPIKTEAA